MTEPTPQQMQQGQAARPSTAFQHGDKTPPNPQPTRHGFHVITGGQSDAIDQFRAKEQEIADQIATSESPVIILSDAYINGRKDGYPDQSYFLDTFQGIPIVFESKEGERAFLKISGIARSAIQSMTLGILQKIDGAPMDSDPQFNEMDCIIQFGQLSQSVENGLKQIEGYDQKIVNHTPASIDKKDIPTAGINFNLVRDADAMARPNGRDPSPLWKTAKGLKI